MRFKLKESERHSEILVSVLVSGSRSLGLNPGQGHCVVFLGKTLDSQIAPL